MRGVTGINLKTAQRIVKFQLTRLMRGVTIDAGSYFDRFSISTHTPHARRDLSGGSPCRPNDKFQLTRLMRGVTSRSVTRSKN